MRKVVFLPGIITPAAVVYAPLLKTLKDEVEPVLKDLEIYAAGAPPAGYRLSHEVDGILRLLDRLGLDSAHFVGYSGGAASLLAFTAAHPRRVRSLGMFEPATIPAQAWMQREQAEWDAMERAMQLPEAGRTAQFIRDYLRPGVPMPPPPPGPPPDWMEHRPAGIRAFVTALRAYDFPLEALRAFESPVYLGYGLQSRSSEEDKAQFLAQTFPHIELEAYTNLHHFTPPQRHEPEQFAAGLRRLWQRAGAD